MAVPIKGCHLISFLLVLTTTTTVSANRRLLRDELVCMHSTDDDCPKLPGGGGSGDPGLVDNVCYPCVGVANNNPGDIVIGLPGLNIAGVGIRFPTISIGNYGVQIGSYMSGFQSSLCCDPSRGNEYTPIAPPCGMSCGGVPLEPDDRVGAPMGPGFGHQGYGMDSPQIPNMMKRQEETPKGRDEHNKHVVKPKMGMAGGQASMFKKEMQRWLIKDNKYVVKPKMETGVQENMGVKHAVKPKMEIQTLERGDKFVVKPKTQMAKESNANNHGDEAREEDKKAHVSVHATPPMSN